MTKFIIRRLLQAIPTFFGITLISYLIMTAAPGDPVSLLTFDPNVTIEEKERLAERLGTNDPWPLQYIRWLIGDDWMTFDTDGDGVADERGDRYGILRGDFGQSFKYKEDTLSLIGNFVLPTIELNIAVLIVGAGIGVPLGIVAAVMRGSTFDSATRVGAVIGQSVPDFWMGFILIMVFGRPILDLLPMGGRCAPTRGGCPPIYDRLEYLVLPTAVLALGLIAIYSRYMRASMLETINSDYVRTARAKGLTNRMVWFRHGARNALIPLATFLGPTITSLLGGAVVIESIFAWPGLGRLFLDSITAQDYPVVMAAVVIGSVATILGYILSDVLYAVFDPRIRFN
jgi:peptide/nickel transport system permease protein